MKTILKTSLLLIAIFMMSCEDGDGNKERTMPPSAGRINQLNVVIPNVLWNGQVGDTIRNIFAAPVDGLPREEPLFSISQMPPQTFTGFSRKARIFLFVEEGELGVTVRTNPYAKPQTGVYVRANSISELCELLQENAANMVEMFKRQEIQERQNRTAGSMLETDKLVAGFDVNMNISSAYRYAKIEDDFHWIRRDIRGGDLNITVYELPIDAINPDSSVISQIIRLRDSIGSREIVTADGGSFITEAAYAPYLHQTKINGMDAWESKGMWEVKNKFMAGPFVNYMIKDTIHNRLLVLEGFAFAPSAEQREYMFELESMLRSARILR